MSEYTPSHTHVIISYDFSGERIRSPEIIEQKLLRDHFNLSDSALFITWSTKRETIQLTSRITVESLPAFLGHFRPLYDIASIFVAPFLLCRRKALPKTITVQDFPLVWSAYIAKLCCGGKVILRLTNLPEELAAQGSFFHRVYFWMHEQLAKHLVDEFAVINKTTQTYIHNLGISYNRITLRAPDTITQHKDHISKVEKGTIRHKYDIAEDTSLILSVGRLAPEKAFTELISVFAESGIPGVLCIVGEGEERASLEAHAKCLCVSDRVIFAGFQDREHIWNYYADADVFVLLSNSEALGLVFWEAMYMSVPVIGRPVGGILETIGENESRGYLWDTDYGADVFARHIQTCVEKTPLVEEKIQRAKKYVTARITAENNH